MPARISVRALIALSSYSSWPAPCAIPAISSRSAALRSTLRPASAAFVPLVSANIRR